MRTITRTTRHGWGCLLPGLLLFVGIFSVILLSVNEPNGRFVSDPKVDTVLSMLLFVLLWFLFACFVYRMIFPVSFVTEITGSQLIFRYPEGGAEDRQFLRLDVQFFYVRPRQFGETSDTVRPIVIKLLPNNYYTVSHKFIDEQNADVFFDAIRALWGPQYVPQVQ